MIASLLLAAAAPMSAVDAERAFAADAQQLGQWTAFSKWAADDALMFLPQPSNAHEFLDDRKEPPVAVFWWPGRSYVSCDGSFAVNTGPWVREWGKSVGYFTTVWQRQPDGGWKWIYDAGDELKVARGEGGDIKPVIASCTGTPPFRKGDPPRDGKAGDGFSPDKTLKWEWQVSAHGARSFDAYIFDGKEYRPVVQDRVAAPPPQ